MRARTLVRILLFVTLVVVATFAIRQALRATAVTVPVAREDAPRSAPGTVTVFAERSAEVRSEVSGRIASSNLELAAPVQSGDVLVQLDTQELAIQITRDENEIKAARQKLEIGNPSLNAALANARDDLAYNEKLAQSGGVGTLVLERARRSVGELEERVRLERVNLEQQLANLESSLALNRLRLGLMTITSPINGVVADVNAGVGDLVNSGAVIARVTSDTRIVEARVSEENFAGVQIGQKATVRFTQYGSWLWDARVSRILPEADPLTQRYRVHLEVEIDREKLVPGITGEASILLDLHENTLVVPRAALVGDSVFVVHDGEVERRRIKVGFTSLNAVEILEGVSEGEPVIVEDLDRFRDGDRVRTEAWTADAFR